MCLSSLKHSGVRAATACDVYESERVIVINDIMLTPSCGIITSNGVRECSGGCLGRKSEEIELVVRPSIDRYRDGLRAIVLGLTSSMKLRPCRSFPAGVKLALVIGDHAGKSSRSRYSPHVSATADQSAVRQKLMCKNLPEKKGSL